MTARLSRPVNVNRLGEGKTLSIEASAEECAALAEALDILAIDSLTAEVSVKPWRGDGVRVEGVVRSTVSQACVVTLEPVPGAVEERFERRLHPDVVESEDIVVDPDQPDPPERLDTHEVDVGAIALEHFALGLDPYPRAPGVEFEAVEEDTGEDDPSPFAALAALKNKPS